MHQATNDVLAQSISEQKAENLRLKARMEKLEDALNPYPLIMTPLAIRALPLEISTSHTPHRFYKLVNPLDVVKSYIINNISERFEIIEHVWQVTFNLRLLVHIIKSFIEWVKVILRETKIL